MFSGGDKGKIKLILLASAADVLWPPGGGHISDRSTGCGGKKGHRDGIHELAVKRWRSEVQEECQSSLVMKQ